ARCAWTRSNGHSRYRRSTAGASARDHAAGSSAYNVVAGPAAYRGRITWTPFTTSRLGMWRKRVYCRSGRTDGSGGQYGTGETTRTSHRSFSARVGRSVQSPSVGSTSLGYERATTSTRGDLVIRERRRLRRRFPRTALRTRPSRTGRTRPSRGTHA